MYALMHKNSLACMNKLKIMYEKIKNMDNYAIKYRNKFIYKSIRQKYQ